MLEKFVPENDFEADIQRTKQQALPASELLYKFAKTEIFVSSVTEVLENGSGFTPLLVGSEGKPLVCVFSSISRPSLHRERASYILRMAGDEFILRTPPGYGVIVNPGYESQLIINSEMVLQLAQELRARRDASKKQMSGD